MIATLTPNPSLDLTYNLRGLEPGEVQRAVSVSVEAGGKGINVSRNLLSNGKASRSIAPLGGSRGDQFISLLEGSGIDLVQVPVGEATRMNVSLVEETGEVTKVNAPGPRLSDGELDHLLSETASIAQEATWLALCGSLPPGVPDDLYARVGALARRAGCRVAVDSSGPTLEAALEAEPDLIKPNLEELSGLVDRTLFTFGEILDALQEARVRGAGAVLVSLGADGAVLLDEEGVIHADTPPFTPKSTVGAGDALLAGFLFAADDREAGLAEAVAWGAAAARLPGSRGPSPGDLDRREVRVHAELDAARELQEI